MKKILTAVTLSLALAPTAAAHERSSETERYFANRCSEQSVRAVKACIHRAAIHWNADYGTGLYIAKRETRYRANICNSEGSGACGLFQFMPRTWAATPYGRYSRFSAKYNSLGWAYLYTRPGGCTHWAAC